MYVAELEWIRMGVMIIGLRGSSAVAGQPGRFVLNAHDAADSVIVTNCDELVLFTSR